MELRIWGATTKTMIVPKGLWGKPIAELCTKDYIGQAQYY